MTIAAFIKAHRQAVLADEANFTDDCVPIDEAAAEASQAVEIQAFQALVRAQCSTHEEVQAKLGYILHGSIGQRDTLVAVLQLYPEEGTDIDGDGMVELFLRSLECTGHRFEEFG